MMYSQENRKTLENVNKKWVRVLTVITYVISVSVVALILGLYYKLAWNPKYDSDNKINRIDLNKVSLVNLGSLNIINSYNINKQLEKEEIKNKIVDIIISGIQKDKTFEFSENSDIYKSSDNKQQLNSEDSDNLILFSLKLNLTNSK